MCARRVLSNSHANYMVHSNLWSTKNSEIIFKTLTKALYVIYVISSFYQVDFLLNYFIIHLK